jgi:2-polyprenyl-3-methyl-5-hydroxy-6-metoxy-1,4-benzoquinol methylase
MFLAVARRDGPIRSSVLPFGTMIRSSDSDMSRSNRTRWESAARREPYYAVLAKPEFLMTNIGESRQAFFESGERDVDALLQFIRAIAPQHPIERVLEYGCGPGRLLVALARRGFEVTGVDVSPAMLEVARANLESFDIKSMRLCTSEDLAAGDVQFDIINVIQVLQMMDRDAGLTTLRMLADMVVPGGFVHLTFPFRTTRSRLAQFALGAREAIPPLNAVFNRMRKRPLHAPLFRPRLHSLDEIVSLLHDAHCDVLRIQIAQEGELTTADVIIRKRAPQLPSSSIEQVRPASVPAANSEYIDPRALIASVGIDGLLARAEAYFASSQDWDQQLAKPFGSLGDAPAMLGSLGVLLHAAQLRAGMTVLDFGGGTGWLSRFLMQLGCDVILADVAPSALRIASDFVTRNPPIGNHVGRFRTSLFDGNVLPIADEHVDRIICFDAFHHVPNADRTLGEFARILKPGGLVAFSEPGPEHSRSAQSQFEMRVHGVLENDFDIHAIWRTARALGFDDARLVSFNALPSLISITEFEDLLARGAALQRAANEMREFTANVRTMILKKYGQERLDSRTAQGLSASIQITLCAEPRVERATRFTAAVTNIGKQVWLPSATQTGGVSLAAHLYAADGSLVDFNFLWLTLSDGEIAPNQHVTVDSEIPPISAGDYVVEFDCVANGITWFAQTGSVTTRIPIRVF